MPIERNKLNEIASDYIASMTSIRGRRVHRLLLREFAGAEVVLKAADGHGRPALVAVDAEGALAICQTDGTGEAATVVALPRSSGLAVGTAFDLKKDSLPIVGWSLWHPGLANAYGTLTLSAAGLNAADVTQIARILGQARSEIQR